MPIGVLPVSGGGGGGSPPPLIIPLGGVMGDSTGAWTTAGAIEINWADYAGVYTTWQYVGITTVSGTPFSATVQLFDQTAVATVATFSSPSTVPLSTSVPLGAIPAAGTNTYLAQVKITGGTPTNADRAVLLSSFIKLS